MTDVSSYKEGETISLMASDIENYNPNEMTATSSYKNSKPSYTTSGVQDQNSYEITTVSSNNKGEGSPCMTSSPVNQNSNEMPKESFYEKGKPSNLDPLDLKNQNPSKSSNISASTKGVWSSLSETPSDFDNQNQPEKTDVSPLKHYPSSYVAYNAGETSQAEQSQYKVPVILNPLMNFNSQEVMLQNQYSSILEDDYPWTSSGRGENTFSEVRNAAFFLILLM
ncbi:hypothetical protein JCGZ_23960 [Jatropha curcas]|uniref:Uncharacterized protein n=1 Tax=Jatropha curcas TaxID=180498 RepID=A0A067K1U1_JATCU|nr:hypothetical protein JCGZ_23960 [Jatropha curcas]